jgi:hypothetical protein
MNPWPRAKHLKRLLQRHSYSAHGSLAEIERSHRRFRGGLGGGSVLTVGQLLPGQEYLMIEQDQGIPTGEITTESGSGLVTEEV